MAAYASLVSLMHVINQIHLHPHPPISLDKQQVESLTSKVIFLQEFLEGYNSHRVGYMNESDGMEIRILDAANAAEDIIESHVVDQILAGSTSHGKKRISSIEFYQSLQKVIENMDLIKKEVQKLGVLEQLHKNSFDAAGSSSRSTVVVGFDDISYRMKDKLIGSAGQLDRKIIPIVGMAGIGKTTLARNLYKDHVVTHHFHILAWCTVSQDYKITKILLELLQEREDALSYMDEDDLAEKLHKRLKGRRYLIIMDDIWDIKVWDRLRFFFPDDNNGSRIILTTRLSNMASQITNTAGINMTFLDEDNSWELFSKIVFGVEHCPLELEEIGKTIVKNCKGLPLSIVVVGGLLVKSKPTPEYWESIMRNLNSVVNSEDDERCLKILYMSYNHLPVYLKPCFLYMGVFPEDSELRFTTLIQLWEAEGFLKPISGKSSEVVAKQFLDDLIDRNLILVHELGSSGNIKYCKIHDLLRDLSIREAQKERFYNVIRQDNLNPPHVIDNDAPRRIVLPQSTTKNEEEKEEKREEEGEEMEAEEEVDVEEEKKKEEEREEEEMEETEEEEEQEEEMEEEEEKEEEEEEEEEPKEEVVKEEVVHWQCTPLLRSLICDINGYLGSLNSRLLRIFEPFAKYPNDRLYSLEELFHLVNSRYLAVRLRHTIFPSSVYLLWNLQTLIIYNERDEEERDITAPPEIWNMPQLRHVYIGAIFLPDPPSHEVEGRGYTILKNLHTLKSVMNFKLSEEVVERIPNIKKLSVQYRQVEGDYNLNNLDRLQKLLGFSCYIILDAEPSRSVELLQSLTFPKSLKKLTIGGMDMHWEDIMEKIGSLPLQVLKLMHGSFRGGRWETIDGQFEHLKFLLIEECENFEHWESESSHFPRLQRLVLKMLEKLNEIPLGFAEIANLKSIELTQCCEPLIISAKRIQEEQDELFGTESTQVRVFLFSDNEEIESLATPNFQVRCLSLSSFIFQAEEENSINIKILQQK